MVELSNKELLNIDGGASWFSASLLNAVSRAITTFVDMGRSVGTAIRRAINGSICPL